MFGSVNRMFEDVVLTVLILEKDNLFAAKMALLLEDNKTSPVVAETGA